MGGVAVDLCVFFIENVALHLWPLSSRSGGGLR